MAVLGTVEAVLMQSFFGAVLGATLLGSVGRRLAVGIRVLLRFPGRVLFQDFVALYTLILLPSALLFFSLLNPSASGGKINFSEVEVFG